jgi:hypothetical protein
MKKVAIVTITSINYGNRLQNYALQYILNKMGCYVGTLRRETKNNSLKQDVKNALQVLLQTKGAKFKKFDRNICFSDEVITRDDYPENLRDSYDYFITGSDQVWNPYYDFVAGKCDFLDFARDNQKISYAASFGVSEIPFERKTEYKEYLKDFKAISVREKQGLKIVEELAGRKAMVVLDPTLLLDENEWKKVEKKPSFCPKNKYVLVYALGEMSNQFKKKIDQLKENYDIFDVRAIKCYGKELPVGPSEFLYLLRNAEVILTDSFHATVFSTIFHKKFVTFNRTGLNMNSRIESLAELVGVQDRLTENGDLNCEMEIDFVSVDEALKEERRKSIAFLKNALSI